METTVKRCYADFIRSRTNTNDVEHFSHPNSAVVLENTKNLRKHVLTDCKLKLCEIAQELMISEGSVLTILHEHLSMWKVCSKLVPCLHTVDQIQQCIDDSERCLQLFQGNEKESLRKYVAMDQTWIYHFTNRKSAEWTAAAESCPKRPKDAKVSRQCTGLRILGCASYFVRRLPRERKNIIGAFDERNRQKPSTNEEEKSTLSPRQWTLSQVDRISNCFRTHPTLQIWPPLTTGCL